MQNSNDVCAGNVMMGFEVGNFAHSVFFWDRLLRPYQSSSSFFSEVAAAKPQQVATQKLGPHAARIDTEQVYFGPLAQYISISQQPAFTETVVARTPNVRQLTGLASNVIRNSLPQELMQKKGSSIILLFLVTCIIPKGTITSMREASERD